MGVLSNLEMFERAGVPTSSFWNEFGLDRSHLSPGLEVPWDVYARFAERAIETAGPDRVDAVVREISRQYRGHWTPMSSSREAIRFLVRDLVPALWPCLRVSLIEAEAPLLALHVEVPTPLYAFRSYHRMNAMGVVGFPLGMDLPEPHLIDIAMRDDGREATYLLELADESLHAVALPPTTVMHAEMVGVLSDTEMLERAGISTADFWAEQGIDPMLIAPGRRVRWDAYAAMLDDAAARAGIDPLANVARELTRQFQPHWPRWSCSRAGLGFLVTEMTSEAWPCLRNRVIPLPSPFFAARFEIPPPLVPCRSYLALSGLALAAAPNAVDLPEATLVLDRIDPTARVGLAVLRLADETVASPVRGIEAAEAMVANSDAMTTAEAIGVLTNLEVFERLGVSGRELWEELGVDPLDVRPGLRVPWDPYARFIEGAIGRVGEDRVAAAVREMPRQYQAHWPKQRTIRDALRFVATELTPTAWPCLRIRFHELPPPLCAIQIETPAPLRPVPSIERMNGVAFAAMPVAVGLPQATLVGTFLDDTQRRAIHVFLLDDERVETPLGPLGANVRGKFMMAFVDICDIAGADVLGWMSRHGLDRTLLLGDELVPWPVLSELLEEARSTVREEDMRAASLQFADLTRSVAAHTTSTRDPFALLELLHSPPLLGDGWGVLAEPAIVRLGDRHALIHMPTRVGVSGVATLFRAHLHALETVTRHIDLPPLRIVASRLDDREGVYVVELPVVPSAVVEGELHNGPSTSPLSAPQAPRDGAATRDPENDRAVSQLATRVVQGVYRERVEARASIVERLGREVARRTDVHSIAEVLTRDLRDHLDANGVEIRLFVDEKDVPLRMRGAREGSLLTRTVAYGSQSIGTVRVWSEPESTGAILAVLDVMMPWVGVAFGTAIDRADASSALATTRGERDAIRDALASVLATHPHAVYVVDARGHVEPANGHASERLAADGKAVLERIAEAVGTGGASFEVHPVRHGDLVDRLVVIERARGALALGDRVQSAAAQWSLTKRQTEVVALLVRGLSNKEIANELGCAEVTVEKHVTESFRRAGVTGRTELAAKLWGS
jgi:DNA-binding CsgD family transcriptional regulator